MLYNEVRPYTFDNVIGQESIVENLRQQSIQNKFFSVYILSGQFGSGKTTIARIIKLAANCSHKDEKGNPCLQCSNCLSILNESSMDCLEIDGASNNGVDQIRELIQNCAYRPTTLPYKVYIVDEVHMLTKSAFNAFLKTLEEPPSYCIFILCTTELEAIPETVRSRSAKYTFKRIPSNLIANHLKEIASQKNLFIEDDALNLISKYSYGAMRNALGLFEQCSIFNQNITSANVMSLIGVEGNEKKFNLLKALIEKNTLSIIDACNEFYSTGIDMSLLLNDLLDILADTIVYSTTKNKESLTNTIEYIDSIVQLSSLCNLDTIFYICNELQDLKAQIYRDNSKATVVVKLVRITQNLNVSYDYLLSKVSTLEEQLNQLLLNSSIISKSSMDILNEDLTDISMTETPSTIHTYEESNECYISPDEEDNELNYLDVQAEDISKEVENNSTEILEKEESKIVTTANTTIVDGFEFDIFDLWNTNDTQSPISNIATISNSVNTTHVNTLESEKQCCESNQFNNEFEELKTDAMVSAALSGCRVVNNNKKITIFTHFPPLLKLINSHIIAKNLKSIEVRTDDTNTVNNE